MKIINTILYTLFVALVLGVAGLLLGSMLPIPGNIEIKIVKSGSMEPAIPTGSIVVVKPSSFYKKGDVITFGKDTKTDVPTTHRIIEVNSDGSFITKGDANEERDQNIAAKQDVIGKVIVSIPFAGFVLDFARQPIGFVLLIAVPAAFVILEEILTITRETRSWWRRKKDGDGGGGGVEEPGDLTGHLKKVYAKKHPMDEILRPMYVQPRMYELLWWKRALHINRDAYGTSTMLTLGLIFTATMISGASGGTLSYFQDIESSVGNFMRAAERLPIAEDEVPELFAASRTSEEEGEVLGVSDEAVPDEDEPEPEVVPETSPEAEQAQMDPSEPVAEAEITEEPAAEEAPVVVPDPEPIPETPVETPVVE